MRQRVMVVFAALAFVTASCQVLLGIDPNVHVLDGADGDLDGPGENPDGDTDGNVTDGGEGGSDAAPFVCPEAGGGPQVPVGSAPYCIDSTEVTVAQYRAFLLARGGDTSGQRADCTGNTTFVPTGGTPPAENDPLPVQYLDFCDAVAFCAWAGKRLCGAIDGGALDIAKVNDARQSQWFRACSRNADGLHQFPYGDTFDQTKCNSYFVDGGPRSVKPVGTYPGCVGGYDGIFDMAGNVGELEDSCTIVEGGVRCAVRGGSFNNGYPGGSACATGGGVSLQPIETTFATTGFRCCSR